MSRWARLLPVPSAARIWSLALRSGSARCQKQAARSATATFKPATPAEGTDKRAADPVVSLAEFRRAALELGLVDGPELDRFSVTSDNVGRLAGVLIRAGILTAYQAAALAQGKAKGLIVGPYVCWTNAARGAWGSSSRRVIARPARLSLSRSCLLRSDAIMRSCVRFRREVEVAARLDHPNIVAALDASEDRGVHFLAMEFIEGQDLEALVTSGGPLPIELAIHCAIQAARGMAAAHAQGIVHRDIKPANLMLATSGVVQVLDLGLARVIESASPLGKSVAGSLDADRRLHGDRRLHRPRAGRRRQVGRPPGGHLQPGLHALLPADGPSALRGRHHAQEAHGSSEPGRLRPSMPPAPMCRRPSRTRTRR